MKKYCKVRLVERNLNLSCKLIDSSKTIDREESIIYKIIVFNFFFSLQLAKVIFIIDIIL